MVDIAGATAGIVSAVINVGKCFMSLFNHKSNLRNLETEVRRLKVERENVEGMVGDARKNAETIKETVEQWVSDVNSIVTEAEMLIDERADFRCFHLKARYKLRREISKKVKNVAELLQLREAFGNQKNGMNDH
ncbi:hypothetical protein Pint_20024 [Pistacia integerrima]|uniref:Uncharacterized protein n=1 Tax=Pistacia integerrima TaxID=434235 RepID=A0ACC0XA16_9ROSI|nr:hypothetical protein Pint_20024 [Pistacia integerrima]